MRTLSEDLLAASGGFSRSHFAVAFMGNDAIPGFCTISGFSSGMLFLVGAFSFKEKSPTITVASFFFRQTTELIAYVPLFTETDKFAQATSTNANLLQRVPPFVFHLFYVTYKTGRLQRVPPFNFFSALCEFFFRKFLIFQKSSPFGFSDILQQKVC